MSDELVKRAQVYSICIDGEMVNLGDRIEALEAQVAKLTRDLETANYTIGLNIKHRATLKGEKP